MQTISYNDFAALDIRMGTIVSVETIADSDKLLRFMIDIGGGEQRQIMAGMKSFFPDLSVLIGLQIPVLLNIAPRLMAGYESQGMILAADDGTGPILLHPSRTIAAGSIVR